MERKQTPGTHWDEEQMERDTKGAPEGKPQGEVWNRHQMETDDAGPGADTVERTVIDDDTTRLDPTPRDDDPAPSGLSGGGQPSGESHWERTEYPEDDKTG